MITIFDHILFICTGNTCRSPFARSLTRRLLQEKYGNKADDINISSAGIYAFAGVSPPPNAIKVAREFGVDLSTQKSRTIHLKMMESADIIFCMTSRQRSHLISRFPWFEDKLHVIKKYALGVEGSHDENEEDEEFYDIQDPIGQGIAVYKKTFTEISDSLKKVIERWETEEGFRKHISSRYRIAVGSDHAGYDLKVDIIDFLEELGHIVTDLGTNSPDKSVDYPQYGKMVSESVVKGENDFGIVFCGSGIGISIAANKVKGARSFPCRSPIEAELSRLHNDCNVLGLGGRLTTPLVAREIVKTWLATPFEGGRHERRVCQIDENMEASE